MISQKTYETWRKNPTGLIRKGAFCEQCGRFNARQATVEVLTTNNKGEVLLIKRAKDPEKDAWALPGGYVDWDETLAETALRELKEETGLTADAVTFFCLNDNLERDKDGRQNIGHAFIAKVSGETNIDKDEVSDLQWFAFDALPNRIAFDHRKIIERYSKHE